MCWDLKNNKPCSTLISIGLIFFIIGVFKKLVLADNFSPLADNIFDLYEKGIQVGFINSWVGAFAYSLQLYFDFSAYSDMAIGLGLIFGIKLPVNFNSPYKATSIIDFWRRWHITLSHFLRDYVYFALGGNRKGTIRRYTNLLITMLLGGLWHGAGWGFIFWGGLHGFYLIINHFFINLGRLYPVLNIPSSLGKALTIFSVVIAWVFFRADTFQAGFSMVNSMLFFDSYVSYQGISIIEVISVAIGFIFVLYLPNTYQMFRYDEVLKGEGYSLNINFFDKATILPSSILSAWLIILHIKVDKKYHTLLIINDSLSAEAYRQLKVALKVRR